ncbi:MAG: 1-deoxy-D-xylulose-5-phosphate reductoisomerase [Oscillospiraceae bacterium]|jgi:1-deoxy-D-xylulose-5-phosphate reductoisomerase|nr:1-deoxy-D-xylulose-5-phosphate reductoisomerase [Oscillospiraceae bacterium]
MPRSALPAKSIALLGSTGSIGTQTLDVVRHLGFRAVSLAAGGGSLDLLARQIEELRPETVCVYREDAAARLKALGSFPGTEIVSGKTGLFACLDGADMTVAAMSSRDLAADVIVRSLERGIPVALADKEALVCDGLRIMAAAASSQTPIIPVDSEHSAIFQCINGHREQVRKVILTASGGAFRSLAPRELETVTYAQALNHPTWSMGEKVTLDSATLMNKGFEFIEAMRLFGLAPDEIEVLIHPQSIVHSMVEFADGTIIAQLGATDMRMPIQYALTYPERAEGILPPISLAQIGMLEFSAPDFSRYPCLELAIRAAKRGEETCRALVEADHEALALFKAGKLRFTEIAGWIAERVGV